MDDENYEIDIIPSTPPPTVTGNGHNVAFQTPPLARFDEAMVGWLFDLSDTSQPTMFFPMDTPDIPQDFLSDYGVADTDIFAPALGPPRLNLPQPEFSSPSGSSLPSMSPLFQILLELAAVTGDRPPPQPFQDVHQDQGRTPFSSPLRGTYDARLDPVTSTLSSEIYSPVEDDRSLLFHSSNERTVLEPLDNTIGVVSSFDGHHLHFPNHSADPPSTPSSGRVGSGHLDLSPFLCDSPLTRQSSPNTNYSSPASFTAPKDSQVYGAEGFCGGSAVNSHERLTMGPERHYPHSPLAVSTFDRSPRVHEVGGFLDLAPPELHLNTGQRSLEPSSPGPSSVQSDVGSILDAGSPVIFQVGPTTSEAHQQASEKRRKNAAKYACSYCPRRLTSRDNLISHQDIHLLIKRFPCDPCSHHFRTRSDLARHKKTLKCRKAHGAFV